MQPIVPCRLRRAHQRWLASAGAYRHWADPVQEPAAAGGMDVWCLLGELEEGPHGGYGVAFQEGLPHPCPRATESSHATLGRVPKVIAACLMGGHFACMILT